MPRHRKSPEDEALTRAEKVLAEGPGGSLDLCAEYAALAGSYKKLHRKFYKTLHISDSYQAQYREASTQLREATRKYLQLKELALPICMYCKRIRTDDDYWHRLESFFSRHADIMFSHGICPECFNTAFTKMGLDKSKMAAALEKATGKPAPEESQVDQDPALEAMRALLRQRAFEGNALPLEVERFVERYGKLSRRFNKILSISDGYQSQLMQLNSRLELMARTDLLTGLANRWEMVARLEAEKSRYERYGTPFSVLLADIDHFKLINDRYGHVAGDRVLRGVAESLRGDLRAEDICSRWGGEEFMIMLPEADLADTAAVAEKLRGKVERKEIKLESQSVSVTVSIGYGIYAAGQSIDAFISGIDHALYRAKSSGRNLAVATSGDEAT